MTPPRGFSGGMPTALKAFLETQGKETPKDIYNYDRGGVYSDRCLFCHDYHLGYQEFYISEYGEGAELVHTYEVRLCKPCMTTMESAWGDKENLIGHFTGQDLFSTVHPNLEHYIRTGLFPEDADSFTLDTHSPNKNHCVLCKLYLKEYEEPSKEWLEIGKFRRILNRVPICGECTLTIHKFKKKGVGESKFKIDICKNCKDDYKIGEDEHYYRTMLDSMGGYWCQKCLCSIGLSGRERYENVKCSSQECENAVVIDMMIHDPPSPHIVKCTKCLNETKPSMASIFEDRQYPDFFVLRVYKFRYMEDKNNEERWFYHILRFPQKEEILLFDSTKLKSGGFYKSSELAVWEGGLKLYDLLYKRDNQLKIDYGYNREPPEFRQEEGT